MQLGCWAMLVAYSYPRIYKDTYLPVPEKPNDSKEAWCPPGHGDVFSAFHESDLFRSLVEQGKEYVFISNIDNLGATVDLGVPH
jgi:UTP--glucose-1-phosphate uridylyltransferase